MKATDEHGNVPLNQSAWHIICALKRKIVSRSRAESRASKRVKQSGKTSEVDLYSVRYEVLLWVLQCIVELKKKHQWEEHIHERNKLMGRAGPQSEIEMPAEEMERRKEAIRANWTEEEHSRRFVGGNRDPYEIPRVRD